MSPVGVAVTPPIAPNRPARSRTGSPAGASRAAAVEAQQVGEADRRDDRVAVERAGGRVDDRQARGPRVVRQERHRRGAGDLRRVRGAARLSAAARHREAIDRAAGFDRPQREVGRPPVQPRRRRIDERIHRRPAGIVSRYASVGKQPQDLTGTTLGTARGDVHRPVGPEAQHSVECRTPGPRAPSPRLRRWRSGGQAEPRVPSPEPRHFVRHNDRRFSQPAV